MNFIRIGNKLINLSNVALIMPISNGGTRFFFVTDGDDYADVNIDFDSVCDMINVREA